MAKMTARCTDKSKQIATGGNTYDHVTLD